MKKKRAVKQNQPKANVSETRAKLPLWAYLIPPSLLALLTTLFYSRSLHYEFQFDSVANISRQFSIRHKTLADYFLAGPRWISYWLNTVYYSFNRFDPFLYRIGNLVIHISTGLLVFFVLLFGLKNLKKKNFFSTNALSIAFFTSVLFLLHPVQTQTVSYVIQGQLEGLAGLFILSLVLCYYFLARAQTKITKILLTVLFFTLGLFSCGTKEIAIISPVVLILFDWFFVAQGNWKSLKKRVPLLGIFGAFIFGIYLWFLKPAFFTNIVGLQKVAKNNIGNVITQKPGQIITPWVFFISQFKVIIHYLWMFIWPFNISVEYDWVLSKSVFSPDSFFPLIFLLALACFLFGLLRKNKTNMVAFGFLWFFVCIAPRSSIIPSPELLVDYKTYLASFGWLFLLASGLVWITIFAVNKIKTFSETKKQYSVQFAGLLLAFCFGTLVMQRNTVWRSGIEFWSNVLKNAPGKARAYNNYGVELSQKLKDYEGAIPYFKKAIAMDRNYADPLNNLAVASSHLGKIDEAIIALQKSLKIQKYYPEGYNNLASFLIQKGQLDKAEKCLELALKLRPHYGKSFFNMGRIHLKRNNKGKAWESFRDACTKADFDIPFGFEIFGQMSLEQKKYDSAIFAYKKLLELEPQNTKGLFGLANAYFLSGKYAEAEKLNTHLLSLKPGDLKITYNLAETYFNLGRFSEALSLYLKTLHAKEVLPYIRIRMANCLEHLGRPYEAKQMIQLFLQEEQKGATQAVLAKLRAKAKVILAQMNKKYPDSVAS